MLPRLFHIVTAIAFLLVTCHAWDFQEGILRIPGLNGLPVKEGKPGLKAFPGLRGNCSGYPPQMYRYSAVFHYLYLINRILLHCTFCPIFKSDRHLEARVSLKVRGAWLLRCFSECYSAP